MSIPLHDTGSVKISETAHSYLKVRADQSNTSVVALIRDLVEKYVANELHVFSMADQLNIANGFGKITGDSQ